MIGKVGDFAYQFCSVSTHGRNDGLGGLLSDFLTDFFDALVQQVVCVRIFPWILAPVFDLGEDLVCDVKYAVFVTETAMLPRVAGAFAHLLHLDQQGVAVTIESHLLDILEIAGGFALMPKLLPRA